MPFIYLEHDPPRESPTETKHLVYDSKVLLVHVTNFNKLMWDSGTTKTKVIEHGVTVPSELKYWGTLRRGVVVINNLESRGRRLGADIFEEVRKQIPLDLLGINSERLGGLGDLPQKQMLGALSQYRFYFSPIRYTSLGLSICEAMMLGLPIVGLATTELPTVVKNGYSGFTSNNLGDLIREMKQLLLDEKLATNLGQGARQTAEKRFNLTRFAKNWEETFEEAVAREKVALEVAL